jgi:hypothetical protein
MAADSEELISEFIDQAAIASQSTFFKKELASIYDLYQKINTTKITLQGSDSFTQVAASTRQLKTDTDALTAAQEKLTKSQTDTAKQIAVVHEQQLQQNKANKDAAREALGLTDAYAQLSKQYDAASRSAKALAAQALIDPSKLQQANQAAVAANDLGNKLKQIDASVGQFQRNVGNYTGAVQILEKSLNDIRNQIDQFNKSGNQNGAVLEKLTREESLLEQILGQNVGGFASLNQEIRNNERALQSMQEQGLKGSEAFEQLRIATADARREMNEFQKSQQLLSSEEPVLAALTSAARGLGAAYAIGAGASALFADGDEKLQKELNKLVAVMTLLQGLTELNTALKERDAIATALQTGAAKIASFAQNVWNATMLEGVVATTAFRIALIGLTGGLLLLLPLIALGASKMDDLKSKEEDAALKAKELNEVNLKANETYADQAVKLTSLAQRFEDSNTTFREKKEITAELNKEFGEYGINLKNVSDTEEFLKDKAPAFLQMLDLKAKATAALALATDEYKKILNAQSKSEDDYVSTTDVVLQGIKSSLNIFRSQSSTFIAATTALSKTAETNRKKEVDDAQKSYDILLKMANGFFDQANQIANKNDFVVKPKVDLNALEKALQDAYNLQKSYLEQFAEFFKRDADNEKNGYDQRLSSLALYYQQKQKLVQLDLDKELNDPKASPKAKLAAEVNAQTQLLSLRAQFNAESSALTQDESNKELAIIIAANAKKLQDEKDFIQAKHDLEKDLIDIITNGGADNATVQARQYADQERELLDSYNQRVITQKQYQDKSLALSKQYSITQFTQQTDTLQKLIDAAGDDIVKREDYEKQLADVKLKFDQQVTDERLSNLQKVNDLEKELAQQSIALLQAVVDGGYDRQKNAIQSQIDLLEQQKAKEIEVADATITNTQDKAAAELAINAKVDAQETQLKQKQKQIDIRKAEFDKAVQVVQIIATTAQAEASLAAKGAEAKAEAALLAANPLTAAYAPIALASAGLITAQQILTAAIGAAQIAAVLATPIPTYALGTDDHIGGHAIVGDAGKHEVALTPDGKALLTPNTSTLVDLPKHTVVFPDVDQYIKTFYAMTTPRMPTYESVKVNSYMYMEEMTNKIDKRLRSVEKTIINKKEAHFHVTQFGLLSQMRDMNNQIDYLNDNFQF